MIQSDKEREGTGFGAGPERTGLFSMLFLGRMCLHINGVLFFFWRLPKRKIRHGGTDGCSHYPELVFYGWRVMEKSGWL